jgi:hypothetical protein
MADMDRRQREMQRGMAELQKKLTDAVTIGTPLTMAGLLARPDIDVVALTGLPRAGLEELIWICTELNIQRFFRVTSATQLSWKDRLFLLLFQLKSGVSRADRPLFFCALLLFLDTTAHMDSPRSLSAGHGCDFSSAAGPGLQNHRASCAHPEDHLPELAALWKTPSRLLGRLLSQVSRRNFTHPR